MNTPVSFETAKLLKNKGFKEPLDSRNNYWNADGSSIQPYKWFTQEELADHIDAPTIAEVVMWLYEKYWIWITVRREFVGSDEWEFSYIISYLPKEFIKAKKRSIHFKTIESFKENIGSYQGAWFLPKEAYEKAIEYTLKNLI